MAKKIGVITLWDSQDNYGQVLQCYALQRYLIKQGHDAYLIKSVSDTLASTSKIQRLMELPQKLFSFRFWSLLYFRYKLRVFNKRYGVVDRHFDQFRADYIHSTDKVYHIADLKANPPQADMYITGSDQVWGAPSELYFLQFAPKGKARYSYAASFGSNPFDAEGCRVMHDYLQSFEEVTVRETSGVTRCKEMGIEAHRIIDPTGLLEAADYEVIADKSTSGKYILLYLLGNFTDVCVDDIFNYARKHNLSVKYVASQGRNDKYDKIFPSPTEWLGLVANAEYVVSNSYHCCMFSMYFGKKFMAMPLIGIFKKMNARMDTLFASYGIPRVTSLEQLDATTFDYSVIGQKLKEDREAAQSIIKRWLNK